MGANEYQISEICRQSLPLLQAAIPKETIFWPICHPPRMNGWETLSALRRIRPDIPVVIVSGYDESKTSNDNHSEHAHIFLHKPYQMAELKDAVTRAMRDD